MSKPSTSVSFGTWFLPNSVPETVTCGAVGHRPAHA